MPTPYVVERAVNLRPPPFPKDAPEDGDDPNLSHFIFTFYGAPSLDEDGNVKAHFGPVAGGVWDRDAGAYVPFGTTTIPSPNQDC